MPGARKEKEARRDELVQAAFELAKAEGLEAVTGRKVAAAAGLSSGLVFFHFGDREALLEAVLDRLVEDLTANIAQAAKGRGLVEFLEQRIDWLKHERREVELFVDFWVLGTRQPAIRRKIRAALAHYRSAVGPLTPKDEGLAGVAVSFVLGCALQSVVDPGHFDTNTYLQTIRGLLAETHA